MRINYSYNIKIGKDKIKYSRYFIFFFRIKFEYLVEISSEI